ncbi:MAG: PKD domain-containing protein [Candidatus Pacearchaeota archaeon]
MNKIIISLVVFALFIVSVALGSVNLVNEMTNTNYSGGEIIKGKIFVSIANEPTSSEARSNFIGNITLLNLIKLQSNVTLGNQYSCSTVDCEGTYVSQGQTDGFLVTETGEKFAGFVVSGTGVSITDATFSVQSNAIASCTPQIGVDVLADGFDVLTNSQSNGESCGTRYSGCYNQSNTIEAVIIANGEYCEKLTLPPSSRFIIGGEIRNGTSNANLTMKLYDSTEGGLAGSCLLPKHTQNIEELSCSVDYTSLQTRDYYVCVTSSNSAGYKIGWETQTPNCGTAEGFGALNSDFDLFAQTTKYSASPNFIVNDSSYQDKFNIELDAVLDGYISDKYNRECQPTPCIIPISFYGANQYIQLSSASIDYQTVGVPNTLAGIHEVSYADALITATNLSIELSKANFVIPIDSNENKFKFFVDDDLVFQKDISIKKGFLFDVQPNFVTFGQNVLFSIISNKTIATSTWDFGDGTPIQNVNGDKISHTYTQKNSSIIQITVNAKDAQGLESTKKVNLFIGDPRILANQTILDYKRRIDNITSQLNLQPSWIIQKMQDIVKIQETSTQLNVIENAYKAATTEEDYREIMIDLIELNMPKAVIVSSSGNFPLSIGYASINPNYIEKIDNTDIVDNQNLANKIAAWMNTYFSAEITFSKIALVRDAQTDVIATLFSINTKPNQVDEKYVYLIFGQDIENAGLYKSNYNIKSISGIGIDYVGLKPESNEIFEFLVTTDISPETLGAYISPQIASLGVEDAPEESCNLNNICDSTENAQSCPEDCSRKWIKFSIISWIILAVAFLVVYIILQEWYKKSYQKHLFPDENDLYNLMNFIYTARRSRLNDEQIRTRLGSQWSSEKISFAFKKISGKRIGMLEIPLFTHSQHKEVVAKLSAKQGYPIDARFIKRPSFS